MDEEAAVFMESPAFKEMVAKRVADFGPGTPELNTFAQGNQFHAAGHRSLCGVHAPNGGVELHLAPGVVCYAFACELYLKALHHIAFGKAPRGHRLHLLFGNLPPETRRITEDIYRAETGRDADQLRDDLLNFNTAFEDWRYVHEAEAQQLRLGALIRFTIALYRSVRDQRPKWPMETPAPYVTMPTFMGGAKTPAEGPA